MTDAADLNASTSKSDPARGHALNPGLSPETVVVAAGRPARTADASPNPPVTFASTYLGTGPLGPGERGYGRYANPSWEPFEEALATLEGSQVPAVLFSSGLAAADAILAQVPHGARLIMPGHSYAGTVQLASEWAARGVFELVLVDVTDTEAVLAELSGNTPHFLWLESPTNPMLGVADLPALISAAKAAGAVVAVDNTFCTPLLQQPLGLGADYVLHSVTKFLAGHSDVVLGAVVTAMDVTRAALVRHRILHGAIASPMDAFLALRGLRTLALRLERAQQNAQVLAERLSRHPAVVRVRYPGLPTDPGHHRAKEQLKGFGAILAIELHRTDTRSAAERADRVVRALQLWFPATSLGGVESLIERRRRHLAEPDSVPESLLRLSVGIENVEDLWADLSRALDA